MKHILIVCNTDQDAKHKFRDMVNLYGSRVISAFFNQLTIKVDDNEYQFISHQHPEKIIGQEYHTVIMDEEVWLTSEQRAMIMSRERL